MDDPSLAGGLSIVIPAYNERDRLPRTLEAVDAWATGNGAVEVLILDDGSTDGTAEVAEAWSARRRYVQSARVLRRRHAGKGSAVAHGLLASSANVRLFMDADLAVPMEDVARVAEAVRAGADVAIGSRQLAGSWRTNEPEYRHIMGRVFNRMISTTVVRGIPDTQCGVKAFTAQAARHIFNRVRLYPADAPSVAKSRVTAFDVEVLAIAQTLGLRIAQVPVRWSHVEVSKVRPLADPLRMLWDAVRVRLNLWRGAYGPRPETRGR
ncbi:MAG: glycosyltransferase family 2 protein [Actinobacteria bacterium]|nr:glycosyltransferase family 2 protein [Actinomycetota bacterium]